MAAETLGMLADPFTVEDFDFGPYQAGVSELAQPPSPGEIREFDVFASALDVAGAQRATRTEVVNGDAGDGKDNVVSAFSSGTPTLE